MEAPQKKEKAMKGTPSRKPRKKWLLLGVLGVLCAGAVALVAILERPVPIPLPEKDPTYLLHKVDAQEIMRLEVTLDTGETYAILHEEGRLTLEGQPDFVIDIDTAAEMLAVASHIEAREKLSLTPQEVAEHLHEFGLDAPYITVRVTSGAGEQWTFYVGDTLAHENSCYFMLEGDPYLYVAPLSTSTVYDMQTGFLHQVESLNFHAQRIDAIALYGRDGKVVVEMALQGTITDADTYYRWMMKSPYMYPCDPEKMISLTDTLGSFRLGAYEAAATEENLRAYGLDDPAMTLVVHQDAGTVGTVGSGGVYDMATYPAGDTILYIGDKRDEMTYYARFQDNIYLISMLILPWLENPAPEDYVLAKPALAPLETLSGITLKAGEREAAITLEKEYRMAEDGTFVVDEEGNRIVDIAVYNEDGEVDGNHFSDAFDRLVQVAASGRLPEGYVPEGEPLFELTLHFQDRPERKIACYAYSALQEAVSIDGVFLHALTKGSLERAAEGIFGSFLE